MIKAKEIGLHKIGLTGVGRIERNLPMESLVEDSILHKQGKLGMRGTVMVDTGRYTGRSPKDKYFVDEPSSTDKIWWGPVNQPISEAIFDELYAKVVSSYNHASDSNTYVFDGFGGADPEYRLPIRVVAKRAWQAHFCHNMFIRPTAEELKSFKPEYTVLAASDVYNERFEKHGMNSETFILFHMRRKLVLIGGTEYGGEIKKGIFSILNYILPQKGVLAMHCSANVNKKGKDTAIFFGLSGTGKTTLSTDPERPLIGDDEHGWSDRGIFNFEGGCYAKVINLNPEYEPDIYNAIRHGALLENVVFEERTRVIDFNDGSKTENTRVSYPLPYIKNSLAAKGKPSMGPHPKQIIFLTCDAYGVLPPVSKLTPEQAMYHFISGYTAKVAGTERGVTDPVATFSPCFGGPFLALHPSEYAKLLKEKMNLHKVKAYLVNTGWVGGSAGSGIPQISLPLTRKIIHAILDGSIESCQFEEYPMFKFQIPVKLGEMERSFLNPREAWTDTQAYTETAHSLVKKFQENYRHYDLGDPEIRAAGPEIA